MMLSILSETFSTLFPSFCAAPYSGQSSPQLPQVDRSPEVQHQPLLPNCPAPKTQCEPSSRGSTPKMQGVPSGEVVANQPFARASLRVTHSVTLVALVAFV